MKARGKNFACGSDTILKTTKGYKTRWAWTSWRGLQNWTQSVFNSAMGCLPSKCLVTSRLHFPGLHQDAYCKGKTGTKGTAVYVTAVQVKNCTYYRRIKLIYFTFNDCPPGPSVILLQVTPNSEIILHHCFEWDRCSEGSFMLLCTPSAKDCVWNARAPMCSLLCWVYFRWIYFDPFSWFSVLCLARHVK